MIPEEFLQSFDIKCAKNIMRIPIRSNSAQSRLFEFTIEHID